ncbi:MAG: Fic family protein [Pseudohongiella sp.]|nr:Fic family protein [Pseudohongiella sp.]
MVRYAIDQEKLQSVPTDSDGWFTMADIESVYTDVPQRTIRDALARLSDQIESTGAKRGKKYRLRCDENKAVISDAPYVKPSGKLQFSEQAQCVLDYINQPRVHRPPVEYNHAFLADYQPNNSRYLPVESAQRLERVGRRMGLAGQAGTYVLKIYDQLLLDLSFHSSRMEGNTYSREQADRLIRQQQAASDRSNEETTMILNHKDAIEYLVKRVHGDDLSVELIQTLHALLSENLVSYGYVGVVRDTDVLIGASSYVPLSGEGNGKEHLTAQLKLIVEKANAITNIFERSLFLLLHISYLQAFIDVNKRTARLTCILPMIKNDYIPISFVGVDQDTYVSCLISFYETGAWQPMAEYFAISYEKSCVQFSDAAKQTGWDEFGAKYRQQRRDILALAIQRLIPASDVGKFAREHLPDSVAAEDIDRFCEMIATATQSLNLAQLAGIGVSRQEFEQWKTLSLN